MQMVDHPPTEAEAEATSPIALEKRQQLVPPGCESKAFREGFLFIRCPNGCNTAFRFARGRTTFVTSTCTITSQKASSSKQKVSTKPSSPRSTRAVQRSITSRAIPRASFAPVSAARSSLPSTSMPTSGLLSPTGSAAKSAVGQDTSPPAAGFYVGIGVTVFLLMVVVVVVGVFAIRRQSRRKAYSAVVPMHSGNKQRVDSGNSRIPDAANPPPPLLPPMSYVYSVVDANSHRAHHQFSDMHINGFGNQRHSPLSTAHRTTLNPSAEGQFQAALPSLARGTNRPSGVNWANTQSESNAFNGQDPTIDPSLPINHVDFGLDSMCHLISSVTEKGIMFSVGTDLSDVYTVGNDAMRNLEKLRKHLSNSCFMYPDGTLPPNIAATDLVTRAASDAKFSYLWKQAILFHLDALAQRYQLEHANRDEAVLTYISSLSEKPTKLMPILNMIFKHPISGAYFVWHHQEYPPTEIRTE
ncbi:hypothetical protein BJ742DRAFT_850623 [Cladochytrium replicatum]|nr:hypothetical protein BJ742DRAFT_850623 [Cladochytrium replicatum]